MTKATRVRGLTRRAALAGLAALPLVHVRTAGAAGRLSVAFREHEVAAANDALRRQVTAWAEQNKVDVAVDFLPSASGKLQLTGAAEVRAKTGHDVMTFLSWDVATAAAALEPMDDIMGRLTATLGAASETATLLGRAGGAWAAVPAPLGTRARAGCIRIAWAMQAGFDPRAVWPARDGKLPKQDDWTWDAFLGLAEKAQKDGMTFAIGLGGGLNSDATDVHGALFQSFGATLVDRAGASRLQSDEVRQCLEFAQRLVRFYPAEAASFDNASNEKAYLAGKSALIMDSPAAWVKAGADAAEVAQDTWFVPVPRGPKGRFVGVQNAFWGVTQFSANKQAAKDLVEALMQRPALEERAVIAAGIDLPPYANAVGLKLWNDAAPPAGALYNYPVRPYQAQKPTVAAAEAPVALAARICNRALHNQMLARLKQGQSLTQVLTWAASELESFGG